MVKPSCVHFFSFAPSNLLNLITGMKKVEVWFNSLNFMERPTFMCSDEDLDPVVSRIFKLPDRVFFWADLVSTPYYFLIVKLSSSSPWLFSMINFKWSSMLSSALHSILTPLVQSLDSPLVGAFWGSAELPHSILLVVYKYLFNIIGINKRKKTNSSQLFLVGDPGTFNQLNHLDSFG